MDKKIKITSFPIFGNTKKGNCQLCGEVEDLRPYGPNNEDICYECGKKNWTKVEEKMDEYFFGKKKK